jgi:hypothetical protein
MLAVINEFFTMHRPGQHSAHRIIDAGYLVCPQPTEIDLVQWLRLLGVNLRDFEYFNNRGDEKFLTVNWVRKNRGRRRW